MEFLRHLSLQPSSTGDDLRAKNDCGGIGACKRNILSPRSTSTIVVLHCISIFRNSNYYVIFLISSMLATETKLDRKAHPKFSSDLFDQHRPQSAFVNSLTFGMIGRIVLRYDHEVKWIRNTFSLAAVSTYTNASAFHRAT